MTPSSQRFVMPHSSMATKSTYRTRLAPSPTEAQHVGNARTYLITWLAARSQSGQVALRIEDIDSPRVRPEATEQIQVDLNWLGLDWDGGIYVQSSNRLEFAP